MGHVPLSDFVHAGKPDDPDDPDALDGETILTHYSFEA